MNMEEEGRPNPVHPKQQENKDERVFKVFLTAIFSTGEVL